MDTAIALQLCMTVAMSLVSAVVGWLGARYRALKASSEEKRTQQDCMQTVCIKYMAERLDALCERYERSPEHDATQTQQLIEEWEVYHGCGGNGIRTARVQRLVGIDLKALGKNTD